MIHRISYKFNYVVNFLFIRIPGFSNIEMIINEIFIKYFPESNESQELFWKTHQEQLIACSKCARTFYPDRLEVHLKSCKGPSKTKIKQGL